MYPGSPEVDSVRRRWAAALSHFISLELSPYVAPTNFHRHVSALA